MLAYYPGPMGPTESQLELGSWRELERAEPDPGGDGAGRGGAAGQPRSRERAGTGSCRWMSATRSSGLIRHTLAGPDRRQRGLAGDRPLLRGTRSSRAQRDGKEMTMADVKTGAQHTGIEKPTHVKGIARATLWANTSRWPVTSPMEPPPRRAPPASPGPNRSTRACRTSRRRKGPRCRRSHNRSMARRERSRSSPFALPMPRPSATRPLPR